MPSSVDELMVANLIEVFNERDATSRQAAIERTYAADVRWTDEDGVSTGRDALEAKCVALQSNLGDLQFVAAGPVHALPGFGHLAWQLVTADGNVAMAGFDAALVNDGVITDLFTVLIPPQQ